jgi:hypothetical protein
MKEDTDKTWMEVHGGFAKDMTMRDYYAGLAMQGLISRESIDSIYGEKVERLAITARFIADAMLELGDED